MPSTKATYRVGDRVVYQGNPLNKAAVRTGQVKKLEDVDGEIKYRIKDTSSGAETLHINAHIVRKM